MIKSSYILYARVSLILWALVCIGKPCSFAEEATNNEPPRFIAHAGGAVGTLVYTNSLESLENNYEKGFRYFEIDLSWTSDNELVAIHDWEGSYAGKFISSEGAEIPTKNKFLQLKSKTGLTQLCLEDVLRWASQKGDVFIVTDVKDGNVRALSKIKNDHQSFQKFVIPQVYTYIEYSEVYELGYPLIILTLYKMRIDPYEVLKFSNQFSPFAITMPWQIVKSGLAYSLQQQNTIVYAHTVNDLDMYQSLRRMGVWGIYTDHIAPR